MSLKNALVLLAALTALALTAGCGSSTTAPSNIEITPNPSPSAPDRPSSDGPVRSAVVPGDETP